MKYLVPTVFYLMVIPLCLAQVNVLSGYIQDASSHEALIGANVFVAGATVGTSTNEYGYFTILSFDRWIAWKSAGRRFRTSDAATRILGRL